MPDVVPHLKLTQEGALKLLNAAVAKAAENQTPMCIAVVDDGANLLAFVRMDGAKIHSIETAIAKARTAVSTRTQTGGIPYELSTKLVMASGGRYTNLNAGLPIIVDGHVIGGIGAGSGTGAEDLEVTKAAVAVIEGAKSFASAEVFPG
ncbi:MAG: heme-binding protein [Proteobacteria bacterium]|nr:heme-binding protein [Pseudomonadota bacterium]